MAVRRTAPIKKPVRLREAAGFATPFVVAGIASFLAFFPGHPTGDTDDTYLQAHGVLPVENWHPTANVAIYRIVFAVWDHPAAILVLQCALIWGGLAGIALAAQRQWSRPVARYFVPIGFLPIVFNYLGALMKDTLSAGFTVVAVALLLLERTTTRNRGWFLVGAALCLWPAYLVKISTLPIVVALLCYIVVRAIVHRRRQAAAFLAVGLAALAVLAVSPRMVDDVLDAKEAHLQHALELFDLAGISHFSGTNALGRSIVPSDRLDDLINGPCYDAGTWDPIGWDGVCSFVSLNSLRVWETDALQQRWRDAILAHPFDYLRHRLSHAMTFALRPGTNQFYYDEVHEQLDWVASRNIVMDAYEAVISRTSTWPHTRPIVWVAVSAALLGALLRRRRLDRAGPFDPVLVAAMIGNLVFYAAVGGDRRVVGVPVLLHRDPDVPDRRRDPPRGSRPPRPSERRRPCPLS